MDVKKQISDYLNNIPEWQKANLELFRKAINKVCPEVAEDIKWGVPVFLLNKKLVCAMSSFKDHSKFNFFEGALISDTHKLFNNGLDSKKHRSIDLFDGDIINVKQLEDLIKSALSLNQ